MTPAVPDPTVEARIAEVLDDHRRGESSNDCFEGLGWVWACFCECGWHGRDRDHEAHVATELAPLLTARAAAPDAHAAVWKAATTAINSVYGTDDRHGYMAKCIADKVIHGTPLPWDYGAETAAAPDALRVVCSQCGERSSAMVKIGTTDGWCTACLDEAAEPAPDALRVAVEALAAVIERGHRRGDRRGECYGFETDLRTALRALLDDPALAGRATGGEG